MGCYDNTDSPMSLFPQPPSPKCPACGMTSRIWPLSRCIDPFHGNIPGLTEQESDEYRNAVKRGVTA